MDIFFFLSLFGTIYAGLSRSMLLTCCSKKKIMGKKVTVPILVKYRTKFFFKLNQKWVQYFFVPLSSKFLFFCKVFILSQHEINILPPTTNFGNIFVIIPNCKYIYKKAVLPSIARRVPRILSNQFSPPKILDFFYLI